MNYEYVKRLKVLPSQLRNEVFDDVVITYENMVNDKDFSTTQSILATLQVILQGLFKK